MAIAEETLANLTIKTDRANKHIFELEEKIKVLRESNPYSLWHQSNPETGQVSYYAKIVHPIPNDFSAIIGDALQNMRSALDHMATHLVNVGSGTSKVKLPYFPVYDSLQEYEINKIRRIGGMSPCAIEAIDATEPYDQGRGRAIWELNKLNNRDKHRLLIPAWGTLTAHSLLKSERVHLENILKETFPAGLHGWQKHSPPVFLEDGKPFLTLPIAELEDYTRFTFKMTFRDPEIVKGKPVVETLKSISNLVRRIIADFYDAGLF